MLVLSFLYHCCDVASRFHPLCLLLLAYFVGGGSKKKMFQAEFVGTIVMIGLTFSPGKYIGEGNIIAEWTAHFIGVVLADRLTDGPQVNPAVSFSMLALGKQSFDAFLVKVCAQLTGGYVAFHAFSYFSSYMEYPQFGGPSMPHRAAAAPATLEVCFIDEFFAAFALLVAIFALNWEFRFAKDDEQNYYVKQGLTAVVIRVLIVCFSSAGPAINPMLATCWHIFDNGGGQDVTLSGAHIVVYWVAPIAGAAAASIMYVLYSSGQEKFFGSTLQKLGDGIKSLEKKKAGAKKKAQADTAGETEKLPAAQKGGTVNGKPVDPDHKDNNWNPKNWFKRKKVD